MLNPVSGTTPVCTCVAHPQQMALLNMRLIPIRQGAPYPGPPALEGFAFFCPDRPSEQMLNHVSGTTPVCTCVTAHPQQMALLNMRLIPDKAGGPLPWASSVRRLCFLWPSSSFIPPHRTRLLRSLLEHSRMPKVSDISWSNGSKTAYSVRLTERLYCQYIRH